MSWPRSVGQEPLYYDALNTGRPAGSIDLTRPPKNSDEKYVSRYIDEQNTPQFPFGYGLTYTTFRYGATQTSSPFSKVAPELSAQALNAQLRANDSQPNRALTVSAEITNTGTRAGEETVQCYVRLQGTSVALPVRALSGFQRISLAPGEKKEVTFELSPEAFAFWNGQNKFGVEPALVTLWISPDSSSGSSAAIQITK